MQARILNQDPSLLADRRTAAAGARHQRRSAARRAPRREYAWLRRHWERRARRAGRDGRDHRAERDRQDAAGRRARAAPSTRRARPSYCHGATCPTRWTGPTLLVLDGRARDRSTVARARGDVPVLTILLADRTTCPRSTAEFALAPLDEDAGAAIVAAYVPRGFDGEPPVELAVRDERRVPAQRPRRARSGRARRTRRRVGVAAHRDRRRAAPSCARWRPSSPTRSRSCGRDDRGAATDGAPRPVVCPFKGLAAFERRRRARTSSGASG